MTDKAEFLESIRHRTRSGQYKPTHAPDVAWTPKEGEPRESPPIEDPPARFLEELGTLGGHGKRVASLEEAHEYVLSLSREREAKLLVRWDAEELEAVDGPLREAGVEVVVARGPEDSERFKEAAARAEIGLSTAEWAIAATGSLVLTSGPGKARTVTLLPPTYVAIVAADRVLGTVSEAIQRYAEAGQVPANLVFHTGPSRSGDIEMEIFVGMHGPGDVHVVLVG